MTGKRKNIIFDLDGTLIDAQFPIGAKAAFVLGAPAPVHVCGANLQYIHVYKRPGLDQFLDWCFDNFENVGKIFFKPSQCREFGRKVFGLFRDGIGWARSWRTFLVDFQKRGGVSCGRENERREFHLRRSFAKMTRWS